MSVCWNLNHLLLRESLELQMQSMREKHTWSFVILPLDGPRKEMPHISKHKAGTWLQGIRAIEAAAARIKGAALAPMRVPVLPKQTKESERNYWKSPGQQAICMMALALYKGPGV